MKGLSWFSSAFVSLLMIILVFVIIAGANMKFQGEVDTYMPYKYAVMVAHRLVSSQETLSHVFTKPDLTAHKNLLDIDKIKSFDDKYGQWESPLADAFDINIAVMGEMSPESHLFCYHWRAEVIDYERTKEVLNPLYYAHAGCMGLGGVDIFCPHKEKITVPYKWSFGRSVWSDMQSQVFEGTKQTMKNHFNNVIDVYTEDDVMTSVLVAAGTGVAVGAALAAPSAGTSMIVAAVVGAVIAKAGMTYMKWKARLRTLKQLSEYVKDSKPTDYMLPVGIVYDDATHIGSLKIWVWKAHSECANPDLNDDIIDKVKRQGRQFLEDME